MFDAGLVRHADIFALYQSAFAEGESQPYLDRVENQPFVLDTHAETERGEEVVLEDVGRIADQSEVGESEQGDTEAEGADRA